MLALTVVSLIKVKGLPDLGVTFSDKIFHFLAYAVLTYLWFATFFYRLNFEKKRAILYAAIISIVFGIIIEALQGGVTASRVSDVYDVLVNTLGVLFTSLVLLNNKRIHIKNV